MTQISTQDFMTAAERKRWEKQQEVIEIFNNIAEECIGKQGMAPERVLRTIADKTELTTPGVKSILQRNGLYTNNTELAQRFNRE